MLQYLLFSCLTGACELFSLSDLLLFAVFGISVVTSSVSSHLTKTVTSDSPVFFSYFKHGLRLHIYKDQHKNVYK